MVPAYRPGTPRAATNRENLVRPLAPQTLARPATGPASAAIAGQTPAVNAMPVFSKPALAPGPKRRTISSPIAGV